jgi:hypothetical protein
MKMENYDELGNQYLQLCEKIRDAFKQDFGEIFVGSKYMAGADGMPITECIRIGREMQRKYKG